MTYGISVECGALIDIFRGCVTEIFWLVSHPFLYSSSHSYGSRCGRPCRNTTYVLHYSYDHSFSVIKFFSIFLAYSTARSAEDGVDGNVPAKQAHVSALARFRREEIEQFVTLSESVVLVTRVRTSLLVSATFSV